VALRAGKSKFGLALAAALAFGAASADESAPVVSESQIKAAFVYNFTRFVEWPDDAFASQSEPLVIGVLGESSVTADLEAIVAGRKVNGRSIVVRSLADAAELAPADVLFVPQADDTRFVELLPAIQGSAVLTVGESPAFAAAAGAIVFVQQDGKLRFEINIAAAERARLKVSAELQKLALSVRREP
jgi:YfiR/HmsC-like